MIVLDSSVLLKVFLRDETGWDEAYTYVQLHQEGKQPISAPTLLQYEVVNILSRTERMPQEKVLETLQTIFQLNIQFHPLGESDLNAVIHFTREYHISAYDASYLVLAEKLRCRFVTADKKLVQALPHLYFVNLFPSMS